MASYTEQVEDLIKEANEVALKQKPPEVKKQKNSNIIRAGDFVKIAVPNFFVRCGYPKSINDAIKEIEKLEKENHDICKLLFKFGIKRESNKAFACENYSDIIKDLAYAKLKSDGFGGNERKIHTIEIPELKDKEFRVSFAKYVKTGVYSPGHYSSSYYEEPEWEPPYLEDEKTHKILTLDYIICRPEMYDSARIEASNVEKVKEN